MTAAGDITGAPHLTILASAGTGKTFALSTRYLALLARGVGPERILAATFTRKAAGEILERILQRLALGAAGDAAAEELALHTGTPGLTRARCAEMLGSMLRSLDRLAVSTIDALFVKMAGAFELELGLPPGWGLIDTFEEKSLRSDALSRAIAAADPEEIVALVEMLHGGEARSMVHASLMKTISETHGLLLASETDAWDFPPPPSPKRENAEIDADIEALAACEIPKTKAGKPRQRWLDGIKDSAAAARSRAWDAFSKKGPAKAIREGQDTFDSVEIPPEIAAILSRLIDDARSHILGVLRRRNLASRELIERFDRELDLIKRREGACSFSDVPRLLLDAGVRDRLHELYFRLDAKYDHLLLDEFQDTSVVQFSLLEPVLDEMMAAGGRTVLCVGDPKQSLYAWREAEPALLEQLPGRWEQMRREPLTESYRSSQAVLDCVNDVFDCVPASKTLRSMESGAEALWSERFKPHAPAAHLRDRKGEARLLCAPITETELTDKGKPRTPAAEELLATRIQFAADRVRAILDECPSASIGVLVRKRDHVRDMIAALHELGITASQEGGTPPTDAAPVAAAVSLLRWIDHPGDTLRQFHVAASPLGGAIGLSLPLSGVKGARSIASKLRREFVGRGPVAMLSRLGRRCGGGMTPFERMRYRQMLGIVQRFGDDEPLRPSRLALRIEDERVERPDRACVRVMTIHASKGLQFDAVVLPTLDEPLQPKSPGAIGTRPSPFEKLTAVSKFPNEELRSLSEDCRTLHTAWLARCVDESLCTLYVAMTRAERLLEMIVDPWPDPGAYAKTSASIVREALVPGEESMPGEVIWTNADGAWHDGLEIESGAVSGTDDSVGEVELKLASPSRTPGRRLARGAPSSLHTHDGAMVRSILSLDKGGAAGRGSIMHAMLEEIDWLDEGPSETAHPDREARPDRQALIARAESLGAEDPAAAADELIALASRKGVREVFTRSRYAGTPELHVERPFAVRLQLDGRERLVTGRFDRVVVVSGPSGPESAEVIDFKTDRIAEAEVEGRVERYRPQLEAYCAAAARLFALPAERVRGTLLFLGPGLAAEAV